MSFFFPSTPSLFSNPMSEKYSVNFRVGMYHVVRLPIILGVLKSGIITSGRSKDGLWDVRTFRVRN